MKKHPVGGQAVIEGVMMRSPHCLAVVVRTPSGSIVVRQRKWISLAEKWKFFRWPFFRGILVLGESLHNGISALNFSASVQEESVGAKESQASIWATMAVAFILAMGLFAALPHFLTWGLGFLSGAETLTTGRSFSFHIVDGIIKLAIFVGYILAISLLPDVKRVFMYHGAEHMGIYAYEKGQDLTIDNARGHTTLHPRCGTAFLLVVLVIAILAFTMIFPFIPPISSVGALNQVFFVFVKLLLLFPIAGTSYEVIKLAGKYPEKGWLRVVIWPGLMMQKVTTRVPDEDQLEVSIASLKTVLESERQFMESPGEKVAERQEEFESFDHFVKSLEEREAV